MSIKDKKQAIKFYATDILEYSKKRMLDKIDVAIDSGVLDIEKWNPVDAPMLLPKIIMASILKSELEPYKGKHTLSERIVKKKTNRLKEFYIKNGSN